MGKPHVDDSGDPSASNPDAENGKEQQPADAGEQAGPLSAADQSKLLDDIMHMETKIVLLHHDFEVLTDSLEDAVQGSVMEKYEPEKPSAPWHKKATLKVARWLVNRPESKPKKVQTTRFSPSEKKDIAITALHVQQQIEKLTAERDAKMAKLDAATRSELEAKSNVVNIRDFVAKRSGRVLQLAEQGQRDDQAQKHKEVPGHEPELRGRTFDGKPMYENKTVADYEQFIDRLRLTDEQKEKLLSVVSGYEESLATAREFDPFIVVPSKGEVIANIMALGAEKLEKIASIMGKPELSIDPANQSFEQMKDDMNIYAIRHYESQAKAYLAPDYKWSAGRKKVSVSIVDMCQYPAVVSGQLPDKQRGDKQLRTCEKYFKEQGMELIHDYQYAMGMQRSLRAYAKAKKNGEPNPEKHIIDFYGKPHETVTMFNQEHNSKISKVAYGDFSPRNRQVYFFWNRPGNRDVRLRGRGAVQVM